MSSGKKTHFITTVIAVLAILAIGGAVWGWLTVFKLGGALQKMAEGQQMSAGMPNVTVDAYVVQEKPIVTPEKFIARVEPIESVSLVARVEGVIEAVHFSEGSMVSKGDLLFTIEKDRYVAELQNARGMLAQAEAAVSQAEKYYQRLKEADPRSVSQADLDNAEGALLQARAQVQQAQANIQLAELDLEYTRITAPISGKIGKSFYTVGNLVNPGSGMLAKIVQLDPIRVLFSPTDKSYLRARNMQMQGKVTDVIPTLRLSDGQRYPEAGTWSFVDNEMDPATGTIAVRALFDNPDSLLLPGGLVYIYIGAKDVQKNPVVPQAALLNDDTGYYVFSVDLEGKIAKKPIEIGSKKEGFAIVESGLQTGEKVVVHGLQKIAPGQEVTVKLVTLPGDNEESE